MAGINEAYAAYQKGDYKQALKEYKKLAKQGNANAQLALGVMNEEGQGVPQNIFKAEEWYLKAANQGNAVAQHIIGLMYLQGQGVFPDGSSSIAL